MTLFAAGIIIGFVFGLVAYRAVVAYLRGNDACTWCGGTGMEPNMPTGGGLPK